MRTVSAFTCDVLPCLDALTTQQIYLVSPSHTHAHTHTHTHTDTLNNELKEKVKRMLRDYETMLKNQSSRLSELDAEREELHIHNTELEARIRDLEMKLGKVTSARDRLDERVEELTATLQGEGEIVLQ